jgi:hypothetical protein
MFRKMAPLKETSIDLDQKKELLSLWVRLKAVELDLKKDKSCFNFVFVY